MNNRTKHELSMKLKKARESQQKANQYLSDVYDLVGTITDDDIYCIATNAENADNLGEAISCFVQYGEYSIEDIIKELSQLN